MYVAIRERLQSSNTSDVGGGSPRIRQVKDGYDSGQDVVHTGHESVRVDKGRAEKAPMFHSHKEERTV